MQGAHAGPALTELYCRFPALSPRSWPSLLEALYGNLASQVGGTAGTEGGRRGYDRGSFSGLHVRMVARREGGRSSVHAVQGGKHVNGGTDDASTQSGSDGARACPRHPLR